MDSTRFLRGHRALIALALSLVGAGACDSCDASSPTPASEPTAPAVRPADTRAELHFRGGSNFLEALREQFGEGVVATAFPRTSGDLLSRVIELPSGLQARVLDDSPLESLVLGDANHAKHVYAARVRLEQDAAHPLGPEFALGEALTGGAHWIGADTLPALALAGDVLIVGDTREAVNQGQAWLATRAMAEDHSPGLTLQVEPGFVSRSLHAMANAAVDRWAAKARRDLEAERTRHTDRPELADPEAALNLAERKLRALVALLPDVGELTLTLSDGPAGPTFDLRVAVTTGSPLAIALASLHALKTRDLARMPTASLRLLVAMPPDREGESWLTALLGERVTPAQQQAFTQIGEALYDGSGPVGLAIGGRDGHSFLAYFGHSESQLDVQAAVRTALGSAWLLRPLGLVIGCGDGAPGVTSEDGALRVGGCEGAKREIVLTRSQMVRGLVLSPASNREPGEAVGVANAMTRAYASEARMTELDAASQRLLSASPDQSVLAALVNVVGLMPSVAGMMGARRPDGEGGTPAGEATVPVALSVSVEPDALRVKLILAPGAGAKLINLGRGMSH
ncbi:MAG: hypothetical protein GXP55_18560 [Deltaproteobacteria bacterium]|nr:hypothetical protein [Deltaproteobacteria bacterium]